MFIYAVFFSHCLMYNLYNYSVWLTINHVLILRFVSDWLCVRLCVRECNMLHVHVRVWKHVGVHFLCDIFISFPSFLLWRNIFVQREAMLFIVSYQCYHVKYTSSASCKLHSPCCTNLLVSVTDVYLKKLTLSVSFCPSPSLYPSLTHIHKCMFACVFIYWKSVTLSM